MSVVVWKMADETTHGTQPNHSDVVSDAFSTDG